MDLEFKHIRKWFLETYTIGKLSYKNAVGEWLYLCEILEDKVRILIDKNNDGDFDDKGEGKVYGKTAIRAGRYEVRLIYSPNFKRLVPILISTYGFTAIEIHPGVDEEDTHGCLLPGENKSKGQVWHSRKWADKITEMVKTAIDSGNKVYITIEEER